MTVPLAPVNQWNRDQCRVIKDEETACVINAREQHDRHKSYGPRSMRYYVTWHGDLEFGISDVRYWDGVGDREMTPGFTEYKNLEYFDGTSDVSASHTWTGTTDGMKSSMDDHIETDWTAKLYSLLDTSFIDDLSRDGAGNVAHTDLVDFVNAMTADPIGSILLQMFIVNISKRHDYAHGDNIFQNFLDAGGQVHIVPGRGIEYMIATKQARLKSLLFSGKKAKNETPEDTLMDRAVYSVISVAAYRAGQYDEDIKNG